MLFMAFVFMFAMLAAMTSVCWLFSILLRFGMTALVWFLLFFSVVGPLMNSVGIDQINDNSRSQFRTLWQHFFIVIGVFVVRKLSLSDISSGLLCLAFGLLLGGGCKYETRVIFISYYILSPTPLRVLIKLVIIIIVDAKIIISRKRIR